MIETISNRWCDQWVVPVVYGGLRGLRGFKIVCAVSARIRVMIFLSFTELYDYESDAPYRSVFQKLFVFDLYGLE